MRGVVAVGLALAAAAVCIAAVAIVAAVRDGEEDGRDARRERAAIRAADPRIPMLRKQPGAGPCRIPAGGPRPRILSGWCELAVDLDDGGAVVTFEERWGPVVDGEGDAAARRFRHSWTVFLARGRVVRIAESGSAPPQYWR